MCELFAVSARKPVPVNNYIEEFASHSKDHPNGWGIAIFYGNAVNLEKEPVTACKSVYLEKRLQHKIEAANMMAHIRLATRGEDRYENCHPFVMRDSAGRTWTLMHNGTIFDCQALDRYCNIQEGKTDSERILYFLVDKINEKAAELKRELNDKERFDVVEQVILEITPNNNKVNLIIYDGTQFYVHINLRNTLHRKCTDEAVFFSTVPLDSGKWEAIPCMQLFAYKDGTLVYTGTPHSNEYIK